MTHSLDACSFTTLVSAQDARDAARERELRRDGALAVPGSQDVSLAAIEIAVRWGDNVLAIEHLSPPRAFRIGDTDDCDYCVPRALLGVGRMALVEVDDAIRVVLPAGARVSRIAGQEVELVSAGAFDKLSLEPGMRIRIALGELSFDVRGVAPEQKHAPKLRPSRRGAAATALSALVQVGMLMATAAFVPALSPDDDDMVSDEQRYVMQYFIDASAEREALDDNHPLSEASLPSDAGDSGTQSDVHTPGDTLTTDAVAALRGGPGRGPQTMDVPLTRAEALQDAADFGMISMLRAAELGNVPMPWDVPVGDTPSSGFFVPDGASGDDPFAWNSTLGLTRPGGIGSDDRGGWYRTGDILASAPGPGGQWSLPLRPQGRRHDPSAPILRSRHQEQGAQLPPGAIQRVVHSNFGRFRACYQSALQSNPSLQGRVAVAFVIGRDGRVVSARDAGSDLPNAGVVSCVVGAFSGLTFTAPESGVVRVTYPLVFIPSNS